MELTRSIRAYAIRVATLHRHKYGLVVVRAGGIGVAYLFPHFPQALQRAEHVAAPQQVAAHDITFRRRHVSIHRRSRDAARRDGLPSPCSGPQGAGEKGEPPLSVPNTASPVVFAIIGPKNEYIEKPSSWWMSSLMMLGGVAEVTQPPAPLSLGAEWRRNHVPPLRPADQAETETHPHLRAPTYVPGRGRCQVWGTVSFGYHWPGYGGRGSLSVPTNTRRTVRCALAHWHMMEPRGMDPEKLRCAAWTRLPIAVHRSNIGPQSPDDLGHTTRPVVFASTPSGQQKISSPR